MFLLEVKEVDVVVNMVVTALDKADVVVAAVRKVKEIDLDTVEDRSPPPICTRLRALLMKRLTWHAANAVRIPAAPRTLPASVSCQDRRGTIDHTPCRLP